MKLLSSLGALLPAVAPAGGRRDDNAVDAKQGDTRRVQRGGALFYAMIVVIVSLLPEEQLDIWVPIAEDSRLNADLRETVVTIAGVAGLLLVAIPILLHVLRIRIWVAPRLRLSRQLSVALIIYMTCLTLIASEWARALAWDGAVAVLPSWLRLATQNLSASHVMAYTGLGLLLVLGWGGRVQPWLIGVAGLVLGGVLELLQQWAPGRDPAWWDLLSDGLGILMGLTAGRLFVLRPRRSGHSEAGPVSRRRRRRPDLVEAQHLVEMGWDAFRAGQDAEQVGSIVPANDAYRRASRAAAKALRLGAHAGATVTDRSASLYYLYGQANLGAAKTSLLLGNHTDKVLGALKESELALQDTLRLVDRDKLVDNARWRGSRSEALVALGMVFLLQERPDEAQAATREALDLAPSDLQARRLATVLGRATLPPNGHDVPMRARPGVVEIARILVDGWQAVGGPIARHGLSFGRHDKATRGPLSPLLLPPPEAPTRRDQALIGAPADRPERTRSGRPDPAPEATSRAEAREGSFRWRRSIHRAAGSKAAS